MKPGTAIVVTFIRPEGDAEERAVVARTTKAMLPLPTGYVPVRFESGVVLIHSSRITPRSAA